MAFESVYKLSFKNVLYRNTILGDWRWHPNIHCV